MRIKRIYTVIHLFVVHLVLIAHSNDEINGIFNYLSNEVVRELDRLVGSANVVFSF